MIVFCHLFNDRSGSPRVLCGAVDALTENCSENVLYVGSKGRGLLENTCIPKHRYWYRRSRLRPITLFNLIASQIHLAAMLSRNRAIPADAVVYVNTLLPFGAALWARLNRRRLICHVHEVSISPAPLRWFLTAVMARTADLLIYVSNDHFKRLPIAGPRAVVLANPVTPAMQTRGMATPFSPRRSGLFEVLMLASPRDFKGIPEFLDLARATADRPDIVFTLVLNADAAEIARYFGRADLPSRVRIHSRTDNPARFYETADLVINLSRVDQWVETFGLTLVEAMSFGIPVIAPPVGGPTEMVSEGVDGFLIDSRDVAAVAERIRRLADSPDLCLRLSEAARAKATSFSQKVFARNLQGHVSSVLNGGLKP
ncbi:glycosyltransferase family 4 protein [uncultured Hoeflea sp.]|uniref:glycosyltransferase family 4 protein n=1 Tax=uncultured Hoeflea sp. TaxID=538666 RepID=UPI0030DC9344